VRDSAVDLVKAVCLLVVVGLHSLMAGVTVGSDGPSVTNALAGNPAFAWATWGVQVMPLFFLLGGFASITQWRRMREKGALPAEYIRQRVNRLARPALLPIALVGATLATLALTGISGGVLREVGFKIGQPLWFLAVYLGCSAFVPLLTRLHEAAPRLTLGGLLLSALVVDTVSVTFHLPAVSALNFLFVWLFIQQLGFWYADGAFSRLPRWATLAGGVAAYGTLVVLTLIVGYSKDMYENLNPPTTCILVLGVGQIFLVAFFKPQFQRLASLAPLRRAADAINRNSMTIYLWHVPVVVIIALTMLGAAMPLPEPLSSGWWETRPLFLSLVAVALIPVVLVIARFEGRRFSFITTRMTAPLAALKVIFSVAGVATILIVGFTPVWSWAIGLALLVVAVWIGPPRVRALRPPRRQELF
jgi:surface polysaccharide O-acyltransferase-like enzyme